ncbi:N-acetylmuramoyl-L-alanine amidase [Octadecabacter sp. G9-8]|uniref:N-acetylmuramoyl-L-alanine amidase n=1 Tax=Octadecabacter dasysiphoniae TaxID=2909341 RepID=A0ABS9CYP1_9RHOB|nr:N-acetylmuramoyl-L-alanine amidase [Octadecabacter dasysiphoniae]MCF2871188.1 N-acetylmuramoyl-L-alanine amidase [Octadecabacter dasysiphoniae]
MFNKPNRRVDRVFIHCSASDHANHDNVATMDRWHRERGWSGVGYHLFIRKDGTLEAGRDLERAPAAQSGHNRGSIAICLHGLKLEKFTTAQFDTLKSLSVQINNAYSGAVTFHGHREVAAKACPVFEYKDVLALNEFGQLGLTGANTKPLIAATSSTDSNNMPVLRRGDRGSAVAQLQRLLMIKDDGIFGPKSDAEVRDFQTTQGLVRDGVVGKNTWAALIANDRVVHDGG